MLMYIYKGSVEYGSTQIWCDYLFVGIEDILIDNTIVYKLSFQILSPASNQ